MADDMEHASEPGPAEGGAAGGGRSRLGGRVLFPQRYLWIVLISALDVAFTSIILALGGAEVNTFADFLLQRWDLWGLVILKFAAVSVAIVLCEVIGRMRYETGRRFAEWAIAISAIPVVVGVVQLVIFAWL